MSHAVVCVRVPKQLVEEKGNLTQALAHMMAPYMEGGAGCERQFMAFQDKEEEYLKEYEEGSTEMIRCEDGTLALPYDDRFRKPGRIGMAFGRDPSHEAPAHLERLQVKHNERYASFDAFCEAWHGATRDEENGRHGYWDNANGKWDWYVIGGRWTGYFPVKNGDAALNPNRLGESGVFGNKPRPYHADVVRLDEIDFDAVTVQMQEKAEKFWDEWQRLLAGEKFDTFYGPRSMALDIGLLKVVQGAPADDEKDRALPWANDVQPDDPRRSWHDVYTVIDRDAFMRTYLACFSPIKAFARLDAENGWTEAGQLGWFGTSGATPESLLERSNDFPAWLRASAPDDLLVAVDYHC